jgi:hypothetical protein
MPDLELLKNLVYVLGTGGAAVAIKRFISKHLSGDVQIRLDFQFGRRRVSLDETKAKRYHGRRCRRRRARSQ